MTRLSARIIGLLVGVWLAGAARESAAVPIQLVGNFYVVSAPLDRDWFTGSFLYDTETKELSFDVTQHLLYGAVGFTGSFYSTAIAAAHPKPGVGTTDTDFGTFERRTGVMVIENDATQASLLAGDWYFQVSSSYSSQEAHLVPAPEPAALTLLLASGGLFALGGRRARD